MEMKRMNLASFAEAASELMAISNEKTAEVPASTSGQQGSAKIVPVTNKDRSLGSESVDTSDVLDFKTFLGETPEVNDYGTLPPVMDLRSRLTGTWNPKFTNPGTAINFENSVLLGSGLGNKKPYGYVEPKRLSVAKQKTKKQRAKMAKASKRANRNK